MNGRPPAPTCPRHEGAAIFFACARCGEFACDACRRGTPEEPVCPACESRVAAPADAFPETVLPGSTPALLRAFSITKRTAFPLAAFALGDLESLLAFLLAALLTTPGGSRPDAAGTILILFLAAVTLVARAITTSAARAAVLAPDESLLDVPAPGTTAPVTVFGLAAAGALLRLPSFLALKVIAHGVPLLLAWGAAEALAFVPGDAGPPLQGAAALLLFGWVELRFSVAVPAFFGESLGPLAALRRSSGLVRGHAIEVAGTFASGWCAALALLLVSLVVASFTATVAAPIGILLCVAAIGVAQLLTSALVDATYWGLRAREREAERRERHLGGRPPR